MKTKARENRLQENLRAVPTQALGGDIVSLNKILGWLALLATLIVIALVVGIVATHSSQDYFQKARSTADFQAYISNNPMGSFGLRLNIGLDDAFIVVFAAFFTILAIRFRYVLDRWLVVVALSAMLVSALLDVMENQHIIVMLHLIQNGQPLNGGESQAQMIVTNIKFHLTYLSIFLFSFGYAKLGGLGKVIAWLLSLGYVPFGILLSVYPVDGNGAGALALARTVFFVAGFILSAVLFFRQSMRSGTMAEVLPDTEAQ